MRPSNWTTPLALAATLVLGLFLGSALTTTPRVLAQQSSTITRSWPPAPRDIVSLPAPKEQRVGTGLGVPGYLYYEVPSDRALVITDAFAGENANLLLWEDINQTSSPKINIKGIAGHRTEFHSPVGAAFAPGSKVIMLNYTTDIHLTGYLTQP